MVVIQSLEELNREFISEVIDRDRVVDALDRDLVTDALDRDPAFEMIDRGPVESKYIEARPAAERKRGALPAISSILLSLAILLALFTLFAASKYSFFNVTTPGIQDEIPEGALLLVHRTDPQLLIVGDNITYMRGRTTTELNKIGSIHENYPDGGSWGFEIGSSADINMETDIIPGEDIVGKVVLTIPVAGAVITLLNDNIHIVFVILGLVMVLFGLYRIKKGGNHNDGKNH